MLHQVNKQNTLCCNMYNLSMDMACKLFQNNLDYSKDVLANSLELMKPRANKKQDVLPQLQSVLSTTLENNAKLYQKA